MFLLLLYARHSLLLSLVAFDFTENFFISPNQVSTQPCSCCSFCSITHHTGGISQSHFELILNVAQTFFNGKQHRRKKWTLISSSHAKNNERIWVKFHFYTRLKLILKHPFYLFIISLGTYGSMLSSGFTYVNMLSARAVMLLFLFLWLSQQDGCVSLVGFGFRAKSYYFKNTRQDYLRIDRRKRVHLSSAFFLHYSHSACHESWTRNCFASFDSKKEKKRSALSGKLHSEMEKLSAR